MLNFYSPQKNYKNRQVRCDSQFLFISFVDKFCDLFCTHLLIIFFYFILSSKINKIKIDLNMLDIEIFINTRGFRSGQTGQT